MLQYPEVPEQMGRPRVDRISTAPIPDGAPKYQRRPRRLEGPSDRGGFRVSNVECRRGAARALIWPPSRGRFITRRNRILLVAGAVIGISRSRVSS